MFLNFSPVYFINSKVLRQPGQLTGIEQRDIACHIMWCSAKKIKIKVKIKIKNKKMWGVSLSQSGHWSAGRRWWVTASPSLVCFSSFLYLLNYLYLDPQVLFCFCSSDSWQGLWVNDWWVLNCWSGSTYPNIPHMNCLNNGSILGT